MHCPRFVPALLATALLTLSGCEFWDSVTIPSSDSTPPLGAARLAELGGQEYDRVVVGSTILEYDVDDPTRAFIPIAAAWDPQGAHHVTMFRGVTRLCEQGGFNQQQFIHLAPLTADQPGSPGDTVDNGVWIGDHVIMNQYDDCNPGWSLVSVEYWWRVRAENYFGAVVDESGGSLTYSP